jgi:hypothetical protein
MSKVVQSGSVNPIACFNCQRDCAIKGELSSLYSAAVKPSDYNTRLYDFVRQLFECLQRMVQGKAVQDAKSLAVALGAIFDWCLSLLYAEKTANTGWLYCPDALMSFYPYIKSCPRCGRLENESISVHKPASDAIGRYTTLCLGAILSEVCRVCRNGFKVRILPTSRGDVDMLIFDATTVVLCEVKSSPLYLLPLCVRYQRPLETSEGDEIAALATHAVITVDDLESRDLYLYLVDGTPIPIRLVRQDSARHLSVKGSRNPDRLCEMLKTVRDTWARMYAGYASRWKENGHLRWFTCGCGSGVDDSKNAPGLDRTDDIKKGVYQMLKLAEKYSRGCQEKRIRVALVSNMHPIVHYDEYLKGFEDALWTREADIQGHTDRVVFIDSDNLLPFYDMLFTLTKSWFRDERLRQAFSVETLFRALGGNP